MPDTEKQPDNEILTLRNQMKKIYLIAFLSLIFVFPLVADEYLIICSGQSNMAGAAPISELPEKFKTVPANVILFQYTDPDKLVEPLAPLTTFANSPFFGPVPSFVHALGTARPKDKFIILFDAVGGSALMQWVPDYEPKKLTFFTNNGTVWQQKAGLYYEPLSQRIALARKAYPNAKPLAFLWLQGESDKGPLAGVYLDNFQRLVTNLRRDCAAPDLLIIAGEPGLADDGVYKALYEFTKIEKNSALVKGRDLSHKQLHYDSKGYLELGKRFSTALLPHIPQTF